MTQGMLPQVVPPVVPHGLTLVIPGAPRTKKNHGRIVRCGGKPRMLPSKVWEDWCKAACAYLDGLCGSPLRRPQLAVPLNCRAVFYRDAERGDAVGYYQGLADLLQHAGIVKDDVWIRSWDGSRLLKDAARPRVELTLEPL